MLWEEERSPTKSKGIKNPILFIFLIQLLIFGYINFSGFTIPGHYFELFFLF